MIRPRHAIFAATLLSLCCANAAVAQQNSEPSHASTSGQSATPSTTSSNPHTPQIKVNILNVCRPTEAEQKEIGAALNKIPGSATYTGEFEATRGRLVPEKEAASRYLRLRRELSGNSTFGNVQYSLSVDEKNTAETLVFKAKDPKDLVLIALEDQISAGVVRPASVLDADTPVTHIKLERFGKNAIALARCEGADQSAYEPLFVQATNLMTRYRKGLGLRTTFRNELAWLASADEAPQAAKPGAKPSETKTSTKHLK